MSNVAVEARQAHRFLVDRCRDERADLAGHGQAGRMLDILHRCLAACRRHLSQRDLIAWEVV